MVTSKFVNMTNSVKYIAFLPLLASIAGAATIGWQQAGGSFFSTPGQAGIVGQGCSTPVQGNGTVRIQSGFLAHPFLENTPPFAVSGLPDLQEMAGFPVITLGLDSVFAGKPSVIPSGFPAIAD
jgi:hypothetical protein